MFTCAAWRSSSAATSPRSRSAARKLWTSRCSGSAGLQAAAKAFIIIRGFQPRKRLQEVIEGLPHCGTLHQIRHFPPAPAGSREAWIMPTISRLTGRFFSVLIPITLAMVLPPAAATGEAGLQPPPPASPSGMNLVTGARTALGSPWRSDFARNGVMAGLPRMTSGHFTAWPTARHFTLAALDRGTPGLLAQVVTSGSQKSPAGAPAKISQPAPKNQSPSPPTLCQIADTVYRADGTPAQGTALFHGRPSP